MSREVDLGFIIGPKGDSIFWLELDTDGNLYMYYVDGATSPDLELDEYGNLWLIVSDEEDADG